MLRAFVLLASAVLLIGFASPSAAARLGADYGVYCVKGRLVIDQRDIEELKYLYKADVCRLDQDPCASEVVEKVNRLGGLGASCACR